ncbi:MAG: hypothetical protein JWO06_3391 [Bacteroidota bacterium]|nr:hypothetical protein [Bacteroidota bacterium]
MEEIQPEDQSNYIQPEDTAHLRQRGGCLTAFLGVSIVLNLLTALFYIAFGATIASALPGLPGWVVYVLALIGVTNAGFGYATWMWKKIGVYGLVTTALLLFPFNLYAGSNPLFAVAGLIGPIILIALVKPLWEYFD